MSFQGLDWSDPRVIKFGALLAVIAVVLVLVQFARRVLISRVREADTRYRMRKFVSFAGYVLIFLIALSYFSDRLQGLAVALGVAGAGIAFALQEVIASFAGWIAITMANFYRTGDRVMVGGIMGDVIDIGVLRTTVMEMGQWVGGDQYNGRIVRVANSFVFKEPVYNYSADFPFLWDEFVIPIRHGSDQELARSILLEIAEEVVGDYTAFARESWRHMVDKYFIEDASVEPAVLVTVNENWMNFALRYVVDVKKRRSTRDLLIRKILSRIDATGGAVSVAAATLELTAVAPLEVRVSRDR